MKRPRRPTRNTARKVVRKAKPRFFAKGDPFYLEPNKVPVGWAYQWQVGCSANSGWRPVPYSRHAHDFPKAAMNPSGFIVIKGLMLCEIPAEHVQKEIYALATKAKAMSREAIGNKEEGKGFYIMPDDWVAEEKIPPDAHHNFGEPVDVDVLVPIRVPVRWKSAASYLKLDFAEYVRRRLLMDRAILGPADDKSGHFANLVYTPVDLFFTPVYKPEGKH
jgi:hypothetical protein